MSKSPDRFMRRVLLRTPTTTSTCREELECGHVLTRPKKYPTLKRRCLECAAVAYSTTAVPAPESWMDHFSRWVGARIARVKRASKSK